MCVNFDSLVNADYEIQNCVRQTDRQRAVLFLTFGYVTLKMNSSTYFVFTTLTYLFLYLFLNQQELSHCCINYYNTIFVFAIMSLKINIELWPTESLAD